MPYGFFGIISIFLLQFFFSRFVRNIAYIKYIYFIKLLELHMWKCGEELLKIFLLVYFSIIDCVVELI